MAKIIVTILLTLTLSGCSLFDALFVRTKETYVPILYCPAPVIPERPELPVNTMTPDQMKSDGEIVKNYVATIVLLQGYASELEKSLNQVDKSNRAYEDLRKQLMQDIQRIKDEEAQPKKPN